MFNTKIPLYAVMLILSLFANTFIVIKLAKKFDYDKLKILILVIFENIGIIYGGKLMTYFTGNYEKFNFLTLGFSSYGGLIGALIFVILFYYLIDKDKNLLNVTLPSIPLVYSIGKIGCFLAGCCHGILYNGLFSITYHYSLVTENGTSYFPVQLLESLVFLVIFIIEYKRVKRGKFNPWILLILCSLSKFILDFLRYSHVGKILTINQIISLIFLIIGIYFWRKNERKEKFLH